MFIVIDGAQQVLGLITIEDIIDQALGSQFEDNFSDFDDPTAVSKLR
jgi:Mg2+/Co2+ transporter CorC